MLPGIGLPVGLLTITGAAIVDATTDNISPFSIIAPPGPRKVMSQFLGQFTALDGVIESSLNGGVTWATLQGFDFFDPASSAVEFEAVAGMLYRFSPATVTLTAGSGYIVSVLQ